MLKGKNVWNEWYQKGMGEMRIGERTVYSFPDMKKSFYDMLRASAEKYPHKTGLCDNWNRSYTYREFLSMTDSLAFYLRETMQVKKGGHGGGSVAAQYICLFSSPGVRKKSGRDRKPVVE